MKKRLLPLLVTFAMLLSACGSTPIPGSSEASGRSHPQDSASALAAGKGLHIVTTTYPLYLFTHGVVDGYGESGAPVEGVTISRLNTGETSCLHDYTLSVSDMKLLESADVIVMNGAGLEDFMEDALAATPAYVIDCSKAVNLLPSIELSDGHTADDGHVHGAYDPHYWMNVSLVSTVLSHLSTELGALDPTHAGQYRQNQDLCSHMLEGLEASVRNTMSGGKEGAADWIMITFHNGFQYFADFTSDQTLSPHLSLLRSIEEEAGSEASAKEINEIISLIREYDIPVLFTEVNGSQATAEAIARETGVRVVELSMVMDGESDKISAYSDAMLANAAAVYYGFTGEEAPSVT